jgi:hypothetical protein
MGDKQKQCIDESEVLRAPRRGRTVVHRDMPGEHVFDADTCWCRPAPIAPDSSRSTEDILDEIGHLDG